GRRCVGVELEARWVSLARANLEHVLPPGARSLAEVRAGDARVLPALLGNLASTVDLIVTSPPYACDAGVIDKTAWLTGARLCERENLSYSTSRANLGHARGETYLAVVCDHFTGRVVWAAKGRSKDVVGAFFDALGDQRCSELRFVSWDGAERIRTVVAARALEAVICLDSFHVISWATKVLDEVRRAEWNHLRRAGGAAVAKEFKGMRWLLLRNWENLAPAPKATIRELGQANKRTFRAWQLKEELRDILAMPLAAARQAIDSWLSYASRSRLDPFVKLARTIGHYRASLDAAIEWELNNEISESNNATMGRIRSAARGFHDPQAFITMIMLDRSGLAPDLPWAKTS
ncbi:MAG: ISL3 family transposase, partial [Actinomycetes bacterium]